MGVGAGAVGPGIYGVSTGGGGGSGTVTNVSVVTANGFAGTVANPSTVPAITLTTSVGTGGSPAITKANGTALSAAVAGTDYSAGTAGLATGVLKSTTGTGALSIAAAGTDYSAPLVATAVSASGNSAGNTFELVTTGASTITRTLPAPVANMVLAFKKVDSGAGTVVITHHAAETIDGANTFTLASQWQAINLISDGTNWFLY